MYVCMYVYCACTGADLHARDDDCCLTPLATSCIYGWPCNFACYQMLDFEWKREGGEDGQPSVLLNHFEFNPASKCIYLFKCTILHNHGYSCLYVSCIDQSPLCAPFNCCGKAAWSSQRQGNKRCIHTHVGRWLKLFTS